MARALRVARSVAFLPQHFLPEENMRSEKVEVKASPWLPAGFCAALSALCLIAYLALQFFVQSDPSSAWVVSFLSFLPMCFYFVGAGMTQMQREIGELRKQLAEIRSNKNA
jgi:hypothetical protein